MKHPVLSDWWEVDAITSARLIPGGQSVELKQIHGPRPDRVTRLYIGRNSIGVLARALLAVHDHLESEGRGYEGSQRA